MNIKLTNGLDLSNFKVMPDKVLVRFTHKDYEDVLLGKEITNELTGEKIRLSVRKDWRKEFDARSTVFRRTAEVLLVGSKVNGVQVGDIAILDYKVDNDDNIVIGEDEIGKYCVCLGVSKYFAKDTYRYANRLNPKDVLMEEKDTLESVSDILGVIRNGKLLAKDPYVFLEFKTAKEMKVSASGILYEQQKQIDQYKVISSSSRSKEKYSIVEGSYITMREGDTFTIELPTKDGLILVCNDSDVKLTKGSFEGMTLDEVAASLNLKTN